MCTNQFPNWKSANQTDYRIFNSERVGFCKNCMWGYEIRTTTILYAKWLSRLLRNYMKEQTGFGAHLDFLNILIKKRRGWDLNPRYKLYTDFRDPHLKPLGHLSFYFILKPTTSNPYDENVFLRKHNLQQYFHFQ